MCLVNIIKNSLSHAMEAHLVHVIWALARKTSANEQHKYFWALYLFLSILKPYKLKILEKLICCCAMNDYDVLLRS